MTVQVKCKNCGNMAPANLFKLDYRYGIVVCPLCQKGKVFKRGEKITPLNAPAEPQVKSPIVVKRELPATGPRKAKPAGWDHEDELLEKMWTERQQQKGRLVRVGKNRMRFTCAKCGYAFTFEEDRKPRGCPYCDTRLPEY